MRKILFFMILSLLLFSCGQNDKYELKGDYRDKPSYGDILIDSSIGEPSTLNPVLASDSSSHDITGIVFNGLVKYDKNLNLTGEIAESWDISDDGLLITFKLKKGVKFHDGVELTSRDVKFTYEKYIDPTVKTAYRSLFELVDRVETPDKYTVKVYYKKPYAPALETWGAAIIPHHLLHDKDFNTADFNRSPVGTGPYIFQKWHTAEKLQLSSNPGYFEGKPFITGYIYRIIPDVSVQFMELLSGSIDMMSLTSDLYTKKTGDEKFNRNFNKFKYPSFSFVYIGYNMENDLFKDVKVRKALAYAVDKQSIIEGVRGGLALPATGPFIPGSWAYNEDVKPYPYDPEKAKKLLAQAGWKKNKNGILEKDGKEFEFTLMTNQGNKEREQIATIAQQQFNKIGITVKIYIVEWAVFISRYIDRRNFDAVVMGWNLSRDPDCYDIWHSSKNNEGEFNFVSYSNPEVDRLLEEGRTTFDRKNRARIYKKIHAIIADEAPYTFLYNPYALPVVHKRIHGIKPEPAGIGYNFTEWYVPNELQKYRTQMAQ